MCYRLRGTRSTTECDPETYHQDALRSCPKTAVVDFLSCNNTLHTLLSQVVPSLWCRAIALEPVTSSCTDHSASPIVEVACLPSCYSQLWSVALPPAPFKLGLTSKGHALVGPGALKRGGMCAAVVLTTWGLDSLTRLTPPQRVIPHQCQ